MTRPMTVLPTLAVASLVLVGLFLVAIFSPPLFNMIFGEAYAWYEWGVIYGIAHVAAALALITLRSRLGLGACAILAMIGFTTFTVFLLSRLTSFIEVWGPPLGFNRVVPIELLIGGVMVVLHALILVGVLDAARRWNLLSPDAGRALPAATLGGIGFAIGFMSWGGTYAFLISPTVMPAFHATVASLSIPHFVAMAGLAIGGRFVVPFALVVSLGGVVLSALNIFVIVTMGGSPWASAEIVALWVLLGAGYVSAAITILRLPAASNEVRWVADL